MSSPSLPSAPSLEQLRKQAKDLLRAHRAGNPQAVARVARARARRAAEAHGRPARRRARARLPELGAPEGLRRARRRARPGPRARLPRGPRLLRGPRLRPARVRPGRTPRAPSPPSRAGTRRSREAGARAVVARRHGFASWAALRRHVAGLRDSGEPFARAYRAVEAHDVDGLRAAARDASPTWPRRSAPTATTCSGWRARRATSASSASCSTRGADPTRGNAHGWTPLHQAAYSNLPLLARMLLDAGVPVDVSARGDGGTPLVVALFWGHREVTEVLAEHGVHPRNLRAAAGLGRLDLVEELVAPDGRLAPEAGAHRAYYRPHSGFPDWRPSDDPQEVLDEALAWAARSDRVDVARAARRARRATSTADVYRGSALMWAAASGRAAAVRRLARPRRRPQRPLDLRRPDPRRGRDAAAPRRPGRPPRRRAARCWTPAPTRAPATPTSTRRPTAGPSTAATRRWRPQSAGA